MGPIKENKLSTNIDIFQKHCETPKPSNEIINPPQINNGTTGS